MKYVDFNSVKIRNFLSIGQSPVEISFKHGLNIITGVNKDKEDRRNGVGKSAIADAIHFAIFGETIRELSKEFIVNSINKKNTYVELKFCVNENNKTKNYRIVRKLKPTKCYLYVDDLDLTESTIPNTNKRIKNILNSSPEVFQNCVIMSLNTTLPFMAQRKVEKRKFIEGILNLEIFSEMLLSARAEYNDVQKKYEHITKDFDHANSICKLLNEQKENIISNVKEQRNKILESVKTIQEEITENKSKIKSINKELFEKSKSKFKSINEKITNILTQLSNVKTKITRHETEIDFHNKKLNNIGTSDDVCPTCLHQITNNDRNHIKKEKDNILKDIRNCEEDIESLNHQVISINQLKQNNINAQNQINEYISNIKTVNNNNKLTKTYIQNLNKNLEKNNKELKDLQKRETSIEVQDLDNKISNNLKEVQELEKDSNTIYKGLSTLEVVKYILSEEGVKSFIVKKILDVLNNRLLYYLQKMDANCICRFNEYFEEEIVNEKGEDCSYFNFSGAERKSIDLAILFTFMDMRRLQGDIAYNIVIFDELLDSSLDERGVELVLNIIKERIETYSESIYIISHRKESVKAATGDVVVLEKKNGITTRVDLNNNLE
jgi:DNA repair exonuclease SbcCD ATPase subunit